MFPPKTKMAVLWFLPYIVLVICLQEAVVFGQQARSKCLGVSGTNSTNQLFQFTFKFDRQTQTAIRRIAFISSTSPSTPISTPAACVDTSRDSHGIYQLGFALNGDAPVLPCGILRNGSNYTMTIAVISNVITRVYTFVCTTGPSGNLNNFPARLNINTFSTGNVLNRLPFRPNTNSLRFHVIQAHGDKVQALKARLGRALQLRVILDKQPSNGLDTIGTAFGVVFIEHDNADIYVEVMTPGLGTIVEVSGSLPGSVFRIRHPVKRDELAKIKIPDSYRHVGTGNRWTTTTRTVRVDVLIEGTVVGVKAISIKRSGSPQPIGEYIAIPDDALGTKYNCYTGTDDRNEGRVLVYAVEDSTRLTVNFNSFNRGGFKINGNQISATTTVRMNKNDVLKMECDNNCKVITLTSNKPVGVITGHEYMRIKNGESIRDHIVSQLPPVSTYGKKFVISAGLRYQIILENPTASVVYSKGAASSVTSPSGTIIQINSGHEEITFADNVFLLVLSREATTGHRPFSFPLPAIHQWAIRLYIVLVPGLTYSWTFIARTGELSKIQIVSAAGLSTLGDVNGFSATPVATSGRSTTRRSELVEFRSASINKPFIVLTEQSTSSNIVSRGSLPYGTRLPVVNPCTPSPNDIINTSFGTRVQNTPGDMIDNDCDGSIDEEGNNAMDDDNDGKIDEDLAPRVVPTNPLVARAGVYVKSLKVSDNAAFKTSSNGQVFNLITNGCSVRAAKSVMNISPFIWNKNVGNGYETLHVIDTPPFYAFFISTPRVYFLVEVGFCNGNLTGSKCDNSCQTSNGRKRRQAEETISLEAEIDISNTKEDGDSMNTVNKNSCTMNKLYWIPPILLLLTIFVETVMITLLQLHRSALKKEM